MKNKLIISLSIMLPVFSVYANCDSNLNKKELTNISILSKSEQFGELDKYLNRYCYLPEKFKEIGQETPNFYSNSVSSFKIFESRDQDIYQRKSKFGQDMLGYSMISNFLIRPLQPDEVEIFNNTQKELKFTPVKYNGIDAKNKTELINYVMPRYVGQTYTKKDVFDLSPVYYSVITNNPKVFKSLSPSLTALITTNKSQIAPIHQFFGPLYPDGSRDITELNDLLLSKINLQTIDKLAFYNPKTITFFELAEIMKDYNMDLYNKLKASKNFRVRPEIMNPKLQEVFRKDILMLLDLKKSIDMEKEHL